MNAKWIPALLLISFLSSAEPGPAVDPSIDPGLHEFCAGLMAGRQQTGRVSRASVVRDALRLLLAPGRLVHPEGLSFPFPEVPRTPQPASGRHLIFSILPAPELLEPDSVSHMRADALRLDSEIRPWNEMAIRLIRSKDTESCEREAREMHFDLSLYRKLLGERNSIWIPDQIDEARIAARVIRRFTRHSSLAWEVIQSTDLEQVRQSLRDPLVEDVVIFAHGISGGRLLDSRGNAYPAGFFDEVSSSIRSLSIFACHSLESLEHYGLDRNLARGPSRHPNRLLFLARGSRLLGGEERVPVRGFRRFMREVEKRVLRFSPDSSPSSSGPVPLPAPIKSCGLGMEGFYPVKGSFGFILNGHFIGAVHAGVPSGPFEYSCGFLRIGMNILEVRSLGLRIRAAIHTEHFTFAPVVVEGNIRDPHLQSFTRPDGSYQGSRLDFIYQNP